MQLLARYEARPIGGLRGTSVREEAMRARDPLRDSPPAPSARVVAPALDPLTSHLVDATQRTILYWDVMRRRGNQYLEHMAQQAPNVLHFGAELVMDGRALDRPVNYGLVRI